MVMLLLTDFFTFENRIKVAFRSDTSVVKDRVQGETDRFKFLVQI
jgi:hypothetical protein